MVGHRGKALPKTHLSPVAIRTLAEVTFNLFTIYTFLTNLIICFKVCCPLNLYARLILQSQFSIVFNLVILLD